MWAKDAQGPFGCLKLVSSELFSLEWPQSAVSRSPGQGAASATFPGAPHLPHSGRYPHKLFQSIRAAELGWVNLQTRAHDVSLQQGVCSGVPCECLEGAGVWLWVWRSLKNQAATQLTWEWLLCSTGVPSRPSDGVRTVPAGFRD